MVRPDPSRSPASRRLAAALGQFRRQDSGIAMLEFALLLPILLILIYAVAEYVNATDNRNKVSALTRTLADLTSQGDRQNPIALDVMKDILASADPVLAPFAAAKATLQISAIGVYGNGTATPYICSTWPKTSALRKVGKVTGMTVPTNFQRNGARYVLAEVSMPYQPLFGTVLGRLMKTMDLTFTWSDMLAWPVRGGVSYGTGRDAEVVLPDGNQCPATI